MAILKLNPSFKDYLWGGQKLKTDYGKKYDGDILAESWELSTHPDGPSYIMTGEHQGKTLQEYIESQGQEILGERAKRFDFFPILIKFIDAKQDLSIQVHPDDDYALKHEKQFGKNEMWYILEAEEGASIYYGTSKEMDQESFGKAIQEDKVLDVLNKVPVKPGDVIYVEAGTIHAIGAGIVLCEIQQNSNVTYRVYDFNRRGKDGKLRELHIAQAVEVSNLKPLDSGFKPQGEEISLEHGTQQTLVKSPYFTVDRVALNGDYKVHIGHESFHAYVCLDGKITLNNEVTLHKGETAFIEANTGEVEVSGHGRYLDAFI